MAKVPTTSISLATNIRDVLNGAGGSVTNSVTSFFTDAAKINMWSKYKPVVSPTAFLDTDERWKGADGNCGLTIPYYNSASTFRTAAMNGTCMWSYTPPKGGTNEPRRLGDFRGYYTDAINPLGMVASNGILSDGEVTFAIDVVLSGSSSDNLLLTDIKVNGILLSNYYLGIFAWKSSSVYEMATSSTKIGSAEALEVAIPISTTGEWNFMPFLCSKAYTGSEPSGATFISINKPAQTMNVITSGSLKKVIPSGMWNPAFNKVLNVSAMLTNATGSSVTFTNIKVWLVRSTGTSPESASTPSGTTVTYSGSVTVPAKSDKIIYLSDISHVMDGSYNYWLAASADQSTEVGYNEIEQSSDMVD